MLIEILMVFVVLIFGLKIYTRLILGMCQSQRRIDGQVVIVTGANTGIGFEAAKDLARRGGKIILACRDMIKASDACNQIRNEIPSAKIIPMKLDLSEMSSVREFCKNFLESETRLDIIINNAGLGTFEEKEARRNSQGYEMQMATNHLGHFLMTNILLDRMIKTGRGRIINVSSTAHAGVRSFDVDNLTAEKHYAKWSTYGLTKLCNIYFTMELDSRLRKKGLSPNKIATYSLHPGGVKTEFLRNSHKIFLLHIFAKIAAFYMKSQYEGAQTTIYCAISEDLDGQSGDYYADCKKEPTSKMAQNVEHAKKLWDKSVQLVGLKPSEYHL